jgi:hypothetical protein
VGHRERHRVGAAILSMSEAVSGLGRTRFAPKQKALFARTELSWFQDRLDRKCEARKIGGGYGTEVSRTRWLASARDETEKPALPPGPGVQVSLNESFRVEFWVVFVHRGYARIRRQSHRLHRSWMSAHPSERSPACNMATSATANIANVASNRPVIRTARVTTRVYADLFGPSRIDFGSIGARPREFNLATTVISALRTFRAQPGRDAAKLPKSR